MGQARKVSADTALCDITDLIVCDILMKRRGRAEHQLFAEVGEIPVLEPPPRAAQPPPTRHEEKARQPPLPLADLACHVQSERMARAWLTSIDRFAPVPAIQSRGVPQRPAEDDSRNVPDAPPSQRKLKLRFISNPLNPSPGGHDIPSSLIEREIGGMVGVVAFARFRPRRHDGSDRVDDFNIGPTEQSCADAGKKR